MFAHSEVFAQLLSPKQPPDRVNGDSAPPDHGRAVPRALEALAEREKFLLIALSLLREKRRIGQKRLR